MKKNVFIGLVIVLVVFAALSCTKVSQFMKLGKVYKNMVPPPTTISTVTAHEDTWHDSITGVASITAAEGVTLAPEVAGTVTEIAFESGAVVKKGDLLVKMDTSSEEAQLRAIEAQISMWKLDFERSKQLLAAKATSQAEYDTAESTLKQGEANADVIRVTIEKKTIRAPFDGRTGIRQVNLGMYVDKAVPIVSLQSVAPIYAETMLPQQVLSNLKTGMPVTITTDAFPGKDFDGTLTAINPDFDAVMRSVRVQATMPNTEGSLRPGMFGRIQIHLPDEQKVLAIPATAVLSAPFGDSVFVVEQSTNGTPGLVVRQQFIRTGRAQGDLISVENGLKPGDKIAGAGVFKLRNGMGVVENNELTPPPVAKPADS